MQRVVEMGERVDIKEWRRLAGSYARALYDVAEKRKVLYVVKEELRILKGLFLKVPELVHIFSAPSIRSSDKRKIVEIISSDFNPTLQSFLYVVADHNRLYLLPEIISCFNEEDDRRNNRIQTYIRTAVEISEDLKEAFKRTLISFLGKEIIPHFRINSDILGGFIVRAGDLLIDNSLRTKILNMGMYLKR